MAHCPRIATRGPRAGRSFGVSGPFVQPLRSLASARAPVDRKESSIRGSHSALHRADGLHRGMHEEASFGLDSQTHEILEQTRVLERQNS